MAREDWKTVFASFLFMVVISVNGRPSDTSFENDLSDKNGVQILEINVLDTNTENEHKNAILKRLFYNVSQAGLNIPVQVIYDSPENVKRSNSVLENLLSTNITRADRNSRRRHLTDVEKIKESIKVQYFGDNNNNNVSDIAPELTSNEVNRTNNALALIINRPEFFQRINNTRKKVPLIFHLFSPPSVTAPTIINEQANDTNAGQKFILPILDKLKEINRRPPVAPPQTYQEPLAAQSAQVAQVAQIAQNAQFQQPAQNAQFRPVAPNAPFQLIGPTAQYQPIAQAAQYPPSVQTVKYRPGAQTAQYQPSEHNAQFQSVAPTTLFQSTGPTAQFQPIAQTAQYQSSAQTAQVAQPGAQFVVPFAQTPTRNNPPAPTPLYYPNAPVSYYRQPTAPLSYIPYPPPLANYYSPYDIYRQWPYSYANYPMLVPNPYHFPINYAPESAEYSRNSEVCQTNIPVYSNYVRNSRTFGQEPEYSDDATNETAQLSGGEPDFEFGKRRYDDDPLLIEYVDRVRQKRNTSSRKDGRRRPLNVAPIERRDTSAEAKRHEEAPMHTRQGSDVGPQISKLIVRRGGVAIAGAGGIATAGSGGTAIVGPGGTAFTTPASSGGVAMVGPGGKVVKVPDLTNVLYGRTSGVAATGAGHATFTNKQGEVFTTSDNTGGIALVNPAGNMLAVSDEENAPLEFGQKTSETKEVQLPAGARLLTTGPIIYYNPVYPTNYL